MKLVGLHIYGYGKFIDFRMEEFSSLHVLFGENEAGKSTIMSFIHSILFGFPTKHQSVLRYEPKTHSAYGGRLTVITKQFGEVVIERVQGNKSAGEVSVSLEDGTIGDEALLDLILGGIDKTMFQSIFSFNIHGLQEVQRLKGEEIGRYLIAAGTVGTDVLLHAEQQLQKELDRLFRPSGRKPILNEQLKLIRENEKELKIAMQQNARYQSLHLEKRRQTEKAADAKVSWKRQKANFKL